MIGEGVGVAAVRLTAFKIRAPRAQLGVILPVRMFDGAHWGNHCSVWR